MVAGGERAGGAGGGDVGTRAQPAVGVHGLEHPRQRRARDGAVDDVVPELGELVEDDVGRILLELVTGVVDLLHVALRSRRANDVRGIRGPSLEPAKALGAHALGQHRDAAAAENARDGDAAPTVISGRRPHRPVTIHVEPAR